MNYKEIDKLLRRLDRQGLSSLADNIMLSLLLSNDALWRATSTTNTSTQDPASGKKKNNLRGVKP